MSDMFISTSARHACSGGVMGSTMGAYPRGTGLNPVEGNGHFFCSCRQLYLSSFSLSLSLSLSLTHTHRYIDFCVPANIIDIQRTMT